MYLTHNSDESNSGSINYKKTQQYISYLYLNICSTCTIQNNFAFTEGKSCFPSMSKIKLENGKIIPMSELQTGDRVQTGKYIYIYI